MGCSFNFTILNKRYSYLKCKICDGYFENAKILPSCYHSFCLVCISQSAMKTFQ